MRHALIRHPDFPCDAVRAIAVEVTRSEAGLALRYILTGDPAALAIPPRSVPERTDGLWRHTCFEAFLGDGEAYTEVNLSPSTQWAAYCFDGYRQGMAPADLVPPVIETARTDTTFELGATLALPPGDRLGLSAVIEEADGRISYWARAHPPGRPDFHHPDCFAADLPASDRP